MRDREHPIKGVMFDLDGTLILSDRTLGHYRLLPHAIETLQGLSRAGMPWLVLTNGSAYPSAEQAAKLRAIGLPLGDHQMLTPNSVAAGMLQAAGLQRVMVLGTEGVSRALAAEELTPCAPHTNTPVDAVYIAWHPDCTMADIHAACHAVLGGAVLYTASDVPWFATQSGRTFGYSCAIGGAITRVTGVEPRITGKPSLDALDFVAARLAVARECVAVIGDDPKVEIEMARAGGALGIGITTGTTSRAEWQVQDSYRAPHHVIDSLEELPALLEIRA